MEEWFVDQAILGAIRYFDSDFFTTVASQVFALDDEEMKIDFIFIVAVISRYGLLSETEIVVKFLRHYLCFPRLLCPPHPSGAPLVTPFSLFPPHIPILHLISEHWIDDDMTDLDGLFTVFPVEEHWKPHVAMRRTNTQPITTIIKTRITVTEQPP